MLDQNRPALCGDGVTIHAPCSSEDFEDGLGRLGRRPRRVVFTGGLGLRRGGLRRAAAGEHAGLVAPSGPASGPAATAARPTATSPAVNYLISWRHRDARPTTPAPRLQFDALRRDRGRLRRRQREVERQRRRLRTPIPPAAYIVQRAGASWRPRPRATPTRSPARTRFTGTDGGECLRQLGRVADRPVSMLACARRHDAAPASTSVATAARRATTAGTSTTSRSSPAPRPKARARQRDRHGHQRRRRPRRSSPRPRASGGQGGDDDEGQEGRRIAVPSRMTSRSGSRSSPGPDPGRARSSSSTRV